jgi:hypothetical protein
MAAGTTVASDEHCWASQQWHPVPAEHTMGFKTGLVCNGAFHVPCRLGTSTAGQASSGTRSSLQWCVSRTLLGSRFVLGLGR